MFGFEGITTAQKYIRVRKIHNKLKLFADCFKLIYITHRNLHF